MNPNLIDLLRDALNVLRLRYQPAEQYRYGLPVFIIVLIGLGVLNAIMLNPLFQNTSISQTTLFFFALTFSTLKWLVYTRALTEVLHYFGSPRIAFLGYTLATEALALPLLLLPTFPELATVFQLFNIWVFWAQFHGVMYISQQKFSKVLIAYAVYLISAILLNGVIVALFHMGGWIDVNELAQSMKAMMLEQK